MNAVSGALGASTLGVGVNVRAALALRQDGSFPDPTVAVGQVLIAPGTGGQILDVGTYLGEHIVYAVMFETGRVVGCLARELIVDERDHPQPSAVPRRTAAPLNDVVPPLSTGGTP